MGFIKNTFKKAMENAKNGFINENAKLIPILEYRAPRSEPFGDEIELEPTDAENEYVVYHEDHNIGWIKSKIKLEKFEEADSLTVVSKNDKVYVAYVPMEE